MSPAQRSAIFDPPADQERSLYNLGPDDFGQIARRRRGANLLGNAVYLCYLRHPGRSLLPNEAVPAAMLALLPTRSVAVPRTSPTILRARQRCASIAPRLKRISVCVPSTEQKCDRCWRWDWKSPPRPIVAMQSSLSGLTGDYL